MRYYFDTSIWLDLFEAREEHHLHKYTYIRQLLEKITHCDDAIIYSKIVINELISLGYTRYELNALFTSYQPFLIYVWYTRQHAGKAKDLAFKRKIPLSDAFHALIARENKATLVTRDRDFKKLRDIVITKTPEELL